MQRLSKGVAGLLALAVVGSAVGADPAVPAIWPVAESKEKLSVAPEVVSEAARQLLRELSSQDFAVREGATKELTEKGAAAFPGLTELVLVSNDEEVKSRTASLIIRYRIPPGQPSEVEKTIRQFEKDARGGVAGARRGGLQAAIGGLRLENIVQAYRIMLGQEKDKGIAGVLESKALTVDGTRARLSLVEGNWDDAEQLFREAMKSKANIGTPADYVAYLVRRRGVAFDPAKELASLGLDKADLPEADAARRDELGYLMYRALGDFNRAADYAKGFADNYGPVGHFGLIESGRYADFVKVTAGETSERTATGRVIAQMLLGDADGASDGTARLVARAESGSSNFEMPLLELLRSGRAEDVIRIAKERPETQAIAFKLLCRQLQIHDALDLFSNKTMPPLSAFYDLMDMGLTAEAKTFLDGIKPDEAALGKNTASYEMDYATAVDRLGQTEKAAAWRKKALDQVDAFYKRMADIAGQENRFKTENNIRSETDQALVSFTVLRNGAKKELEQSVSLSHDPLIKDFDTLEMVGEWMRINGIGDGAEMSASERYRFIEDVLSGKAGAEALVKEAVFPPVYTPSLDAPRWDLYVVDELHRLHRDDLAQAFVERWSAYEHDPVRLARLGDWALEGGKPAEALKWYRQAAVTDLTDASLMYRMGLACARQPATKDQGLDLMAFAPWLVLGDHAQAMALRNAMEKFEGKDVADRWYDSYVAQNRLCGFAGDDVLESLQRRAAQAEAKGDFAGALQLREQVLFCAPDTRSWDNSDSEYVSHMHIEADYQRAQALDAWARKDVKTLGDALWREMDNGLPDVATMEKVWGVLKAGDAAQAGKVAGRAMERLREVVELEPGAEQYKKELARVEALGK